MALLRGPARLTLSPTIPPTSQVVIHPGQRCTTVDGHDLSQAMDLGVRTGATIPTVRR